jgi:hypothetical protein
LAANVLHDNRVHLIAPLPSSAPAHVLAMSSWSRGGWVISSRPRNVVGDNYAGEYPKVLFRKRGIASAQCSETCRPDFDRDVVRTLKRVSGAIDDQLAQDWIFFENTAAVVQDDLGDALISAYA